VGGAVAEVTVMVGVTCAITTTHTCPMVGGLWVRGGRFSPRLVLVSERGRLGGGGVVRSAAVCGGASVTDLMINTTICAAASGSGPATAAIRLFGRRNSTPPQGGQDEECNCGN
jgi:hypothetical protein